MFWEYDARFGRRWNVDPRPFPNISQFAVFANNPIIYVDNNGDTTYVYNLNGQFVTVIYDVLKTNEIVFLNDKTANWALGIMNSYNGNLSSISSNILSRYLRRPSVAEARITSATINSLTQHYGTDYERGGVTYLDPKTKEVKVWECTNCKSNQGSNKFNQNVLNYNIPDYVKNNLFSVWHSHIGDNYLSSQPTDPETPSGDIDYSGWFNVASPKFKSGGVGIIVNKSAITIYPLTALLGDQLSPGTTDKGTKFLLKKAFSSDYSGIKYSWSYGSFNSKTSLKTWTK